MNFSLQQWSYRHLDRTYANWLTFLHPPLYILFAHRSFA